MNKQELKAAAETLFKTHSIDELHLTSDGHGYSKENLHLANSHAQTLKDKKVYKFEREEVKQEAPAPVESSDLDREAFSCRI